MSDIEVYAPGLPQQGRGFQKGHPRYGGRRKGTRNKFGRDLRQEVVAAIQETGFIEKDDKGNPIATGEGGCKGFIKWLALHEPKGHLGELRHVEISGRSCVRRSPYLRGAGRCRGGACDR